MPLPTTPKSTHRRQASNPETPSSEKQRLRGLFKDGQWHCNCSPRELARIFRVQKEGPNKGRQFYRCPRGGNLKCKFFLWEDEARTRQNGLTPSEKQRADAEETAPTPGLSRTPKMRQKSLASYGYTSRRRNSDEVTTSGSESEGLVNTASKGKRKRDIESDQESFGSLDSDEEQEMLAIADAMSQNPKTPAATKMVAGLPTPSTTRTLFPGATEGRGGKRQKTTNFEDLPSTPSKSPSNVPSNSPATTKTVSFNSQPTFVSPDQPKIDPTEAVMTILQPYALSTTDADAVKNLFLTEYRKRLGAEKSSEAKTARIKQRDAEIAKLQEVVAALKNKEKVMHSQITQMKAKGMRLYQDFGKI